MSRPVFRDALLTFSETGAACSASRASLMKAVGSTFLPSTSVADLGGAAPVALATADTGVCRLCQRRHLCDCRAAGCGCRVLAPTGCPAGSSRAPIPLEPALPRIREACREPKRLDDLLLVVSDGRSGACAVLWQIRLSKQDNRRRGISAKVPFRPIHGRQDIPYILSGYVLTLS